MRPRPSPPLPYSGIGEPMGGSVLVTGGAGLFGGILERGPYRHRMIGEDFMFDASRMEEAMGWPPTMGDFRLPKPIS